MNRVKMYDIWRKMIARCDNPNVYAYERYGGRGITVCDRWRGTSGFDNFFADMGQKPSPKYTIDRVDNNGDYTPENCRWATRSEQRRNTERYKRQIIIDGQAKTLSEWCEVYGIKPSNIRNRTRDGWDIVKAIVTPINKPGHRFHS